MLRLQRNININLVVWGLFSCSMGFIHFICMFIHLDVYHLDNQQYYFFFFEEYPFNSPIKDLFPFYDAPKDVSLDIQWYLLLVGLRAALFIENCMLLFTYGVVQFLIKRELSLKMQTHRNVFRFRVVCTALWLYSLLAYILVAGQVLPIWPSIIYIILVYLIFFVRKTETGYVINKEE